ncbi:TPR repeat containing protein [Gluconacetobacter sacchari DSM 12717]|uniref:Tetratricopeptide repeat protein n=2 Tax=Gluconacetobacter sacchari TaxID=92759 RepID=A0A7W4IBE7_9PROT|nr:tetratricopeptide repeat protein [Gluconacetobacter sacchari]MBB2159753.1 tetratricopeptide repeat protein [Gluconacetobacter sacchari]GBQ23520.1 TPR repeat containing protein [Gluconacetobacter sacchari DSM 12717]
MQRLRSFCAFLLALSAPAGALSAREVAGPPAPVVESGAASWPPGLDAPYLVATVAALEGEDAVAATAFRQAAQIDPAQPVLLRRAFLYSALAGDDSAAVLAARLPGQTLAELVLGNQAVRTGQWTGALAAYGRVRTDALLATVRPLLEGWTLLGAGKGERALAALDPLVADHDLGGYYAVHAALIARAAGWTDRADRFMRAALAAPESGHDLFAVLTLGHWLIGQGRRAQAAHLVDVLLAGAPGLSLSRQGIVAAMDRAPPAAPRQGIAQAYTFLAGLVGQEVERMADPSGRLAQDVGLRDMRMLLLRFALGLDPAQGQARLMLSALQYESGHAAAARDMLAGVGADDPLASVIQLQLARLDAATGRWDDAKAVLDRLIAAQPGQPRIWQTLGDLQSDRQDWLGAESSYSRAIAAAGTLTGDDWLLLFGRAVAYDRLDRWPQAQSDLEHALALAPDEGLLLNYLGYSLVQQGRDLPHAESLLRRAVALEPQNAAIRDSLGWALVRQGHIAEGVAVLERAAEQTPEDQAVNYHLGVAYQESGRLREAINQWHFAQGLPASDPGDARRISDALAEAARSVHQVGPPVQAPSGQKKD